MAKVKRGESVSSSRVTYSVMLNVVAQGTKKMEVEQQDAYIAKEPESVSVIIRDTNNPENVMFSGVLSWTEFKPNDAGEFSIGFKAHETGQSFSQPVE